MSNLNAAGDGQTYSNLTAQVFLAYATADWPDGEPLEQPVAQAAVRPGAAAVQALRQLLSEAQITCWEYPQVYSIALHPEVAISRAVESCDNYLLVLTPHSLTDALCLQGLLFALSLNKRIVPVLAKTVPAEHLPEPLQTLDTIDLRTGVPPLADTASGQQLLQTLHHEANYHRAHTQLLVKALQWERLSRDSALLLQGEDLTGFQHWLVEANQRSRYQPLRLQTLYVAESACNGGDRTNGIRQGIGWIQRWLA
ncbi:toll/interleukin-1 receptor domain-containing protein [Leptolyngbya sp. KIOST-1]|uniref:toll/interleukin-1 receptor domain-containing protein n=1 Tax=Leptolyngbya sp. KIOST-1 TaxID=1229172 RepID=UPI000AE7AC8F|nr:toll/interleukin-1 receptor domain-containing protein [Leptolyngbya sp. KIOST-1]